MRLGAILHQQAARAYDRAAIRLYGERSKTNFVRAEYPQELKAWMDKEREASARHLGEQRHATHKTALGTIVQQSVLAATKTVPITVQVQDNTASRQPTSSGQRLDSYYQEESSGTGSSRRKGQNPTHCKRKAQFDLDKQQNQSSRDSGAGHPASRIIDQLLDGAQGQLITGSSKASNTAGTLPSLPNASPVSYLCIICHADI